MEYPIQIIVEESYDDSLLQSTMNAKVPAEIKNFDFNQSINNKSLDMACMRPLFTRKQITKYAFSSNAKRFQDDSLMVPGPGAYESQGKNDITQFVQTNLNKKGFGAFISGDQRFHYPRSSTPASQLTHSRISKNVQQNTRPKSVPTTKKRSNFIYKQETIITPGPQDYNYQFPDNPRHYSNVFRSTARRFPLKFIPEKQNPQQQQQIIQFPQKLIQQSSDKDHSQSRSKQRLLKINELSALNNHQIVKEIQQQQQNLLMEMRQNRVIKQLKYKSDYTIIKDRTKETLKKHLSNKKNQVIPGPGSYLYFEKQKQPNEFGSSAFESKIQKFDKPLHTVDSNVGPGSYELTIQTKKNFNNNYYEKWI